MRLGWLLQAGAVQQVVKSINHLFIRKVSFWAGTFVMGCCNRCGSCSTKPAINQVSAELVV